MNFNIFNISKTGGSGRWLAAMMLAIILLAFPLSPASASALNDFNLIVLGNLYGSSNVAGRVVVFGDIEGNAKDIAQSSQAVTDEVDTDGLNQTDTLIVGGQIKGTVQVNNGGARVGGSAIGDQINNEDYVTYNDDSVSDILSAVQMDIDTTLSFLDSLTTDSYVTLVTTTEGTKANFDVDAGDDNIAVFEIDASLLNSNAIPDLIGDLENVDLIVIKVTTGDTLLIEGGFNMANEFLLAEYQSKIIWYMPDVENLTIARLMGGSVIAPNANLTLKSAVEGTVVANNVTMNAQVHLPSLDTTAIDNQSSPAPVPEPSTYLLLSLGLLALAALGRGRRLALPRKLRKPAFPAETLS